MTDWDRKSYANWLAGMNEPALEKEAAVVVTLAVKGLDVAFMLSALQAEYGERGQTARFIVIYNSVIGGK